MIKLLLNFSGRINYAAKRFISEFPEKRWSLTSLKRLIRKIDATGTTERTKGSDRPRTARMVHSIDSVDKLALNQEDKPGTHSTQREIARELGIAQSTVNRIVRQDIRLKCFKKHRATELTEANKLARLKRARALWRRYPAILVNLVVFTDEKIFTVARPSNTQNDRMCATYGTLKKQVPAAGRRTRT